MADVKVRGIDEILKKLHALPTRIQKNVVTGAIRASASAISKEAKLNVHKDEGDLKKAISVVKRKTKDKSLIYFSVVPKSKAMHKLQDAKGEKHYNYGGLVEFGSSKMAAKPYLRPAFEKKGAEAIEIAKKYMSKRIDKELAKL